MPDVALDKWLLALLLFSLATTLRSQVSKSFCDFRNSLYPRVVHVRVHSGESGVSKTEGTVQHESLRTLACHYSPFTLHYFLTTGIGSILLFTLKIQGTVPEPLKNKQNPDFVEMKLIFTE